MPITIALRSSFILSLIFLFLEPSSIFRSQTTVSSSKDSFYFYPLINSTFRLIIILASFYYWSSFFVLVFAHPLSQLQSFCFILSLNSSFSFYFSWLWTFFFCRSQSLQSHFILLVFSSFSKIFILPPWASISSLFWFHTDLRCLFSFCPAS